MAECTVQLWYNSRRPKKNGKVSLYIQLIVNGEHDEIPLKKLDWPVDKINWAKKELMARFQEDSELVTYNAIIERERAKYWSVIMDFLKKEIPFALADVYRGVNRCHTGTMFCEFMAKAIVDRQKTINKKDMIKRSTAGVHTSTLKNFKDFLENGDIEISRVDGDVLERYADYLRQQIAENTVWVRIQNIKSYLSYAIRHKIPVNLDYKRCQIKVEETDPTWLEEKEINRLLDLYWGTNIDDKKLASEQRRNLRAFLFACFTGLRISDLSRWNKDWIKDDHISFIPLKKRKSVRAKPLLIPIIPIAREFIDDLHAETFELPEDQVYNRGLKLIADVAGFTKNITSHVARHTFATWLAIDGVPVLVISKLLGHKTTVTTMIYIHIAEVYKAREMMKMQYRFGARAKKLESLVNNNDCGKIVSLPPRNV